MNGGSLFAGNRPFIALFQCFILAVSYVGSLYVCKSSLPRDHPVTIRQRMKSVAVISIIGPLFVYGCSISTNDSPTIFRWLGLHTNNIFASLFLPLSLTMALFMGPLVLAIHDVGVTNLKENLMTGSWFADLAWYRTFVVAPFTEEFIFRACMLPILVPNFGLKWSILLAPLFFGIAHFHHIKEQLRLGHELIPVLFQAFFQLFYTTLFGVYTAFLFLRTGNLIGPVICHSFCNMMGFPDFESLFSSGYPKIISVIFICGLLLFIKLLFPLTDPSLFNSIYWV